MPHSELFVNPFISSSVFTSLFLRMAKISSKSPCYLLWCPENVRQTTEASTHGSKKILMVSRSKQSHRILNLHCGTRLQKCLETTWDPWLSVPLTTLTYFLVVSWLFLVVSWPRWSIDRIPLWCWCIKLDCPCTYISISMCLSAHCSIYSWQSSW